MANEEQLAILKQGVKVWNDWRKERARQNRFHTLQEPDLSEASFRGADLKEANISGLNLTRADLAWVDLSNANIQHANLVGTDVRWANLFGAKLESANLRGANAFGTTFVETNLHWADVAEITFGHTVLADIDLSMVKGLDSVHHLAPSSVGIDTIYRSKGNIPEAFLKGCGVPEDMIVYARSLRGKVLEFYSCFISHSAKDQRFCERLYADLQARGIRTWYFPEDAKWGESVWGEIDRSIKIYDKLIVVCSENSLQSVPVQREIERALNREDKEHKNILFPIRIDDYIFDHWEHERKADVLAKVVGDFSGWERDAAKYEKAFDKLLKGLQAEQNVSSRTSPTNASA